MPCRSRATGPARAAALALLLMLLLAPRVAANGGTIQLSDEPAGPYQVTVLTSPSPIMAGRVDVSVAVLDPSLLLTDPQQDDLVHDAQVQITAKRTGDAGAGTSYPATHDQATNKLLYAANVAVPDAGQWQFTVQVTAAHGQGSAAFTATVEPVPGSGDPAVVVFLGLPVVVAALVFGGMWLRRRRAPLERAGD